MDRLKARKLTMLQDCADLNRRLVAHYNKQIRLERRALKRYGDQSGFLVLLIRENMKSRYSAKMSLAREKKKIAVLAATPD